MTPDAKRSLLQEHIKRSTKASDVPEKVKDRKVLLDLARLLKR